MTTFDLPHRAPTVAIFAFALAALSPLGFAACGGDESESSPASGGGAGGSGGSAGGGAAGAAGGDAGLDPAKVAACATNAQGICARHKDCFVSAANSYGTVCEAQYRELCLATTFADGSGFTPALLDDCTSSYATVSCEEWIQWWVGVANTLPKCVPPAGDRPNGEACSRSTQCQSGYCSVSSASACGSCQARAAEGGDCTKPADCQLGMNCTSGKCAPYRKEGESCDFVVNRCTPGTHNCDPATGKCVKPKSNVGDACSFLDDCAIYEKGLACNAVSSKCEAAGFSDPSGECGNTAAGGYAFCKDGATCQVDVANVSVWKGSCISAKKLGEPCDPSFISGPNGGPCLFPYVCRDGVCGSPVDPGCK